MDKPKHTPAPWHWRGGSLEPVEPKPTEHHLSAILDEDGARLFTNYTAAASAELKADHQLIAAAPDMLEALRTAEEALAWLVERGPDGAEPALAAVRAAIAKAMQP